MTAGVIHADCIEAMVGMADSSIDAIVTDPPYGLGFMGKAWDDLPPGREWADQCLRVLKPGGHLLAFGGTRTYHRLACAIEDAGFEIRDCLAWLYGSGFPKSLDVSKAIDKSAGAERRVVGPNPTWREAKRANQIMHPVTGDGATVLTAPATPDAERWEGWGTALKPAHEPVVCARKPMAGTVAANVLEHGTGALNIDACRVGTGDDRRSPLKADGTRSQQVGEGWDRPWRHGDQRKEAESSSGRWPANVVLSHTPWCEEVGTRRVRAGNHGAAPGGFGAANLYGDGNRGLDVSGGYADADGMEEVSAWRCVEGCPVRALDEQTGGMRARGNVTPTHRGRSKANGWGMRDEVGPVDKGDKGGASRFFFVAQRHILDECVHAPTAEQSSSPDAAHHSSAPSDAATLGSPAGILSSDSMDPSTSETPISSSGDNETGTPRTPSIDCASSHVLPHTRRIPNSSRANDAEAAVPTDITTTTPNHSTSGGYVADATSPNTSCSMEAGARDSPLPIDSGTEVRFRYCAKASSAERSAGLDDFPTRTAHTLAGGEMVAEGRTAVKGKRTARNTHPTVKPIALMRWLVRLVTPPGGLVLDPFAGSGTTGCACVAEGFRFVGIEREAEYVEIARARIAHHAVAQLRFAA